MKPSEPQPKADCYAKGDRGMMIWWAGLRARTLGPFLSFLRKCHINADGLTFISLILGLAFCPVFLLSKPVALVLLLLHVLIDGLDGPMARYMGTASRKGSFADTMVDQTIIAVTTATMIATDLIGIYVGIFYLFTYTVVVAFSVVRNAMSIPYNWLVRPRFLIYSWLIIELYVWPGTLNYVVLGSGVLLGGFMLSGFRRIRNKI
jgi:phosphatidylglycerophosphate synthase